MGNNNQISSSDFFPSLAHSSNSQPSKQPISQDFSFSINDAILFIGKYEWNRLVQSFSQPFVGFHSITNEINNKNNNKLKNKVYFNDFIYFLSLKFEKMVIFFFNENIINSIL